MWGSAKNSTSSLSDTAAQELGKAADRGSAAVNDDVAGASKMAEGLKDAASQAAQGAGEAADSVAAEAGDATDTASGLADDVKGTWQ